MSVRWSDGGPFGVIPAWVLEADISDRAVRAYAMLARHAGAEGSTFRGKKELAERLRCGRTAADNAVGELVGIGAISVEERFANNGARIENGYVVHAAPPHREDGGATTVERGATRARSLPEEPSTALEPSKELTAARRAFLINDTTPSQHDVAPGLVPSKVSRKTVTDEEAVLSCFVLGTWNRLTGQNVIAHDWLTKIIMRIREHPELDFLQHHAVIACALANPWWKDTPAPSVVYGNEALFERNLEAAKAITSGTPVIAKTDMRYGRGMTTRQILDTYVNGGTDDAG